MVVVVVAVMVVGFLVTFFFRRVLGYWSYKNGMIHKGIYEFFIFIFYFTFIFKKIVKILTEGPFSVTESKVRDE